jgi:3-oxoadipate CoA-transferase alpha subunit
MIDKIVQSVAAALDGIKDGSTILCGGFGAIGTPNMLIEGLIEQGARDLTVVTNNGGYSKDVGLPKLMELGRVRKLVCSFPMGAGVVQALVQAGKLELEVVPQGTLAERIRAAGAGVPAFYTPTSVGTTLAANKEHRDFNGKTYVMEEALPGDVALIEAWSADRMGNLSYRGSGRNFNCVMATAGQLTVVQVHQIVSLGEIDPNDVVTPSLYVDRVIVGDSKTFEAYASAR